MEREAKYLSLSDEELNSEGYHLVDVSGADDEEKQELDAWMNAAGQRWSPAAWDRVDSAELAVAENA
jgi:hypothetical protein